ncbi:MAG TPA: sigma-70 family RNA polymerase sigma factor [Actinophytocola sp.]|uniref:sigma-70 family RNA polymerase sigma factor n=1 Tax=Actinophytocola sp. TaxID=1872138 RepID=UPI002DDD0213|nr:sigma-70 family RNA polymerase sigma factor [Actinophytocola sp.]HEV2780141.1 sigma-70 family RNA polymerase sigma factor [Actinophytocola sp.]
MGLADQEWFAALYQSCYRRLVLATYALTNDLGEAEEITQEAFALAYGRMARVAAADQPEAWIRTVAVNLARRRGRRRAMLDRLLRRDHPEVLAPAGSDERLDVHRAIRALRSEQRAVVVLHYLADLPVDEVASLLDIPIGTVKSRLSRARAALAAALGTPAEVDHA